MNTSFVPSVRRAWPQKYLMLWGRRGGLRGQNPWWEQQTRFSREAGCLDPQCTCCRVRGIPVKDQGELERGRLLLTSVTRERERKWEQRGRGRRREKGRGRGREEDYCTDRGTAELEKFSVSKDDVHHCQKALKQSEKKPRTNASKNQHPVPPLSCNTSIAVVIKQHSKKKRGCQTY